MCGLLPPASRVELARRSSLVWVFGCSSEPARNDGGNSDDEYLDDAGDCRRPLEDGVFACEASYEAALAAPNR
jgi:hypothetical protein